MLDNWASYAATSAFHMNSLCHHYYCKPTTHCNKLSELGATMLRPAL